MMFEALMNQDQTVVEEQIGNLVDRIGKFENKTPEETLILKPFLRSSPISIRKRVSTNLFF